MCLGYLRERKENSVASAQMRSTVVSHTVWTQLCNGSPLVHRQASDPLAFCWKLTDLRYTNHTNCFMGAI